MVEITYQMVLSTLQTVGLLVGIVYYVTIMRNAQRNQQVALETRQAQLFMQLFTKINERELQTFIGEIMLRWEFSNLDEFMEKYGPENNLEDSITFSMVGTYFSGMGILVRENLVDIRLVTRFFGSTVKAFWEKIEPIIGDFRELEGFQSYLSDTEYLYNEMMKYMEKHPELRT
jgi:hypothetical protein